MMMTNFKWSTILLVHVLLFLIVTEIYASHIPPPPAPPENSIYEFGEQRKDLIVDKVKRIIYGWRKLSHQERNEFKNQVKEIPDDIQTENNPTFQSTRAQSNNVYKNVDLYSYYSYLYYYPIIEWNLDRTPDTDDYWVGIYKEGAKNDDYIIHERLGKSAQGTYYVGKLKTKYGLESKNRFEKYELRLFKGDYQRVDAVSNTLHGIVHSPPINIDSPEAKLQAKNDEPKTEPKLKAFLSTIEDIEDISNSEVAEELLSASYYSQEELLQLWSEFNKQEQQLLFPILEQDSLPDEIKKPTQTQFDDCLEPKELYPNLGDNLVLTQGLGNGPNHITLNIAIRESYTYVYPVVELKSTLSGKWAWMGLYRSNNSTNFNPNGYLRKQWVGPGYDKTNKLDKIEEEKEGPVSTQYVGTIFDYINGAYQQIGFASNVIQATISATPAAPPPKFIVDFDVGQALTMAQLSSIAYEDYETVKKKVENHGLHSTYRIYDSETDTNGFIASNATTVVVAFRGTSSLKNAVTDATLGKKQITSKAKEMGHLGFVIALNSVYNIVKDKVLTELGKRELYITGHSLGCGLASLFAFRLAVEYKLQPTLFGYGCPPTGDKSFSDFFEALPSYIITNDGDPVSTGALTTYGPWVGLYKPREVFFLQEKGTGLIHPHYITVYIEQLKKIQQK